MIKPKQRKHGWIDTIFPDDCEKDGGKTSLEKEKSSLDGNRHPHKILWTGKEIYLGIDYELYHLGLRGLELVKELESRLGLMEK